MCQCCAEIMFNKDIVVNLKLYLGIEERLQKTGGAL